MEARLLKLEEQTAHLATSVAILIAAVKNDDTFDRLKSIEDEFACLERRVYELSNAAEGRDWELLTRALARVNVLQETEASAMHKIANLEREVERSNKERNEVVSYLARRTYWSFVAAASAVFGVIAVLTR